ncbi:hypothetical protein INT45_013007 [Circinella minor]|uniref:F-box domain-containing protein n=1 Tax=Circinella minor TaxID=1195481 RepID=A0A8H7VBQ2_9FUNG|nr:hypothetical protein INT45_013007 [Circinella minor]
MKVPFTGNAFMLKLSPSNNDKTNAKVATTSSPIMVSFPVSLPTSSLSPTNGFTTTSPSATAITTTATTTETETDIKRKKRSSCIMISTISNTATNTIRRGRRATMTPTTASSGIQLLTIEILLPDELITHILMYLHTDIKTLSAIAEVSPRLHRITMNVIRSYFLPNIQLSTVIDQEGRRKSTMQYVFDTLDNDTLEIQFRPITVSPQRYRNDNFAASPTLHRLSINDINNYSSPDDSSSLSWPFPTTHSLSSSDNEEEDETNDDHNNNGSSRRQTSWHTLDSITSMHNIKNTDHFNNKNNMKKTTEITSGKRKQLLQITKPGTFLSSSTNGSLWQLEYLVSTDHHSAFMSANIAAAIMNNTNKHNHSQLSMSDDDSGNER